MLLAVERQDVGADTSVITLRGKLMLGEEAARLDSVISESMITGHKNLVFDLSGVTHIDSTGIGRFINTYSRLGATGGQMHLAGATGAVRGSFRVTRLDTVFTFYPTVESACEGLK